MYIPNGYNSTIYVYNFNISPVNLTLLQLLGNKEHLFPAINLMSPVNPSKKTVLAHHLKSHSHTHKNIVSCRTAAMSPQTLLK